nr:F-box domain-containing protein [Tanacetum cinerariifolium]
LNLKDMLLWKIEPPDQFSHEFTPLGMINGCLCMIENCGDMGFNLWVMKEQRVENSWTKRWSFTLRVEGNYSTKLCHICSLDSGKMLFMDRSHQLSIYYTSNDLSKKLNGREEVKVSYIHMLHVTKEMASSM